MAELYGREEFLTRHYASDIPVTINNQKPLFFVSIITSKYYSDIEKMKACVLNALKNKRETHEIRFSMMESLNPAEYSDLYINFTAWAESEGFCCGMPHQRLSDCLDNGDSAIITFDSTKEYNSQLIFAAKDYAEFNKIPIKSY